MPHIQRLLVANRGEIAMRVMHTAHAMGIEVVAIYSDADRDALHTQSADQAVYIGASAPSESYLNIDRVIEAALSTGCDAIHPGYGFLSENAPFAQACAEHNIIFIGPSAEAIELMGDKAQAKRAMLKADVPCIPGYQDSDQANDVLVQAAVDIGMPVMIKAAAGGGGRGMRLVHNAGDLEDAINTARAEARSAFGADELIIEKAIENPRHIEIQVFGDTQGSIIYLGERDCSVQRRHQKVIEEAPSPVVGEDLRRAMGEAAVAAAQAVSYVGAGTVEFLLGEDQQFYFLEMNTRLQVEHPVTELVTGLDLVELQLQVAAGRPLGITQEEIQLHGHAIEVRLYAEDPQNDFLPSTGKIEHWVQPDGPGIRLDHGFDSGNEVSPFYDPMLAKVIASGKDREQARRRLTYGLGSSMLIGPATNRDFLVDALSKEDFAEGQATTAFIEENYGELGFVHGPTHNHIAIMAVTDFQHKRAQANHNALGLDAELMDWTNGAPLRYPSDYRSGETVWNCQVIPVAKDTYQVIVNETDAFDLEITDRTEHRASLTLNGQRITLCHHVSADQITIALPDIQFTVTDITAGEHSAEGAGSGRIIAPMHEQLVELLVSTGENVHKGQRIAVLEAMKMQHDILADVDGKITAISAEAGQQITVDSLILEIEPVEA